MASSFATEEDIVLIDFVRANQVLYDGTQDIEAKETLWKEIAVKLQKSVYQCKRRWKNVKIAYLRNKDNLETDLSGKVNNVQPLLSHLTFLDVIFKQNNTSVEENSEQKIQLEPSEINGDSSIVPKSEQKIQLEPSEINGDSSVIPNSEIKIELEPLVIDNHTSAMKNDEIKIQLEPHKNESNKSVILNGETKIQLEQPVKKEFKLSPDAIPFSIEKVPQPKDLLKEIRTLKQKSNSNKTLDLFFESIKVDLENFTAQDIDKVKQCILTCVSKCRNMYSEFPDVSSVKVKNNSVSDTPTENPCLKSNGEKCAKSEENITLNNILHEIQELKKELTASTSLDLFFKSVSADMEGFQIRAIDQIKLDILKFVSEVKEQYSIQKVPTGKSKVGNAIPNGLQTAIPNNRPRPTPNQGCFMYYNVPQPLYYNIPPHNPHSYF